MKLKTKSVLLVLFGLLWFSVSALAQTGPKDGLDLPPADLTRIKVGAAAPDFTLNDQDGKPVTLSSYRGKNVVLVFYRGHW
jgi:cytochrome oxidase Cu insertion factor (SCO1/SenC/PrrC family)